MGWKWQSKPRMILAGILHPVACWRFIWLNREWGRRRGWWKLVKQTLAYTEAARGGRRADLEEAGKLRD